MTTLLERFDASEVETAVFDFRRVNTPDVAEIRRAIAIAQVVEERANLPDLGRVIPRLIIARAEELLRGGVEQESKLSRAVKLARGGEAPPLPFNSGRNRMREGGK